ncbi:MAG TPA: Xaa-Pro peptidase family protein [Methanocorpusculum sp.]|nr:Xaa-Pro peptidase family protein [Methanocorpusculum sp.]
MKRLSEEITRQSCDAYVIYNSASNADMRYVSGFSATDPYIYVHKADGSSTLIVSVMEELRARKESACSVITRSALNMPSLLKETCDIERATARMIVQFAGAHLLIPRTMEIGFAQKLMEEAESVIVDENCTVEKIRMEKSEDELAKIRAVQKVNERALDAAVSAIRRAEVRGGLLFLDGKPLTSDMVRDIIHFEMHKGGSSDIDTIVSCGSETAMPHAAGERQLYANQPIVMDLFPRDMRSGYFADMTRTVSRGRPSEEIIAMYEAVREAKRLAEGMIKPGITGAEVHNAVVSFFKEKGFETAGNSGFIHSLGHGVGLEIHESPNLSPSGGELMPGHVVTVEPGLYYPGVGGVRLEDMGVVTADGFEIFTNYEEELIIE